MWLLRADYFVYDRRCSLVGYVLQLSLQQYSNESKTIWSSDVDKDNIKKTRFSHSLTIY